MQYKTITLALLEADPARSARLKAERQLLPTMERLAAELKTSHQRLTAQLSRSHPELSEAHRSGAALELVVEELRAGLRPESISSAEEA